jgi:uncharacterized surface protein with fasciclin (FAS1) repeats
LQSNLAFARAQLVSEQCDVCIMYCAILQLRSPRKIPFRLFLVIVRAQACQSRSPTICIVNIFLFNVSMNQGVVYSSVIGLSECAETSESDDLRPQQRRGYKSMRYKLTTASLLAVAGLVFTAGCQQPSGSQQQGGQSQQPGQATQPGQTQPSRQTGQGQASSQQGMRSSEQRRMGAAGQSTENMVDMVKSSGNFNTLSKALQSAGLTDTLSRGGPYTLFAPTDAAFSQLPPGRLDEWMRPENKATLQQVLKYHVVEGRMNMAQMRQGKTMTTLEGDPVTVKEQGGRMTVDGAMIEGSEMDASNGMIYAINKVMMPPGMEEQSSSSSY